MSQIPGSDRPTAFGSQHVPSAAPLANATKSAAPSIATESGAAFRVLLERREESARELSARSVEVTDASDLAGAVDSARASLADAMTLGERLLEAYREARLQGGASTPLPENRS